MRAFEDKLQDMTMPWEWGIIIFATAPRALMLTHIIAMLVYSARQGEKMDTSGLEPKTTRLR